MDTLESGAARVAWAPGDFLHTPFYVYEDPEIYALEQQRIFRGSVWSYLGLEVEVPQPGDYLTTFVGDMPIIVVRARDGTLRAVVNRCSHKGSQICAKPTGNVGMFVCPYHNWTYDFDGHLKNVAFRQGVNGKGGMPADFDPAQHRLVTLKVDTVAGLIFGSLDLGVMSLADYLGPKLVAHIKRTLKTKVRILGKSSQYMHCNWKLYVENARDTYHPSLLHSFATTFKINRLSAEGGIILDDAGWHHLVFARRQTDTGKSTAYDTSGIRATKVGYDLADPRIIDSWPEFEDGITNSIMTLFPCFNLQQSLNIVATRQLVPRGPEAAELYWTFLGFEGDDEEQTMTRIRQANISGPAGLVSLEDGVIGQYVQRAIRSDRFRSTVMEMGGRDIGSTDTRTTENSVRGFWRTYRQFMGI